jgi:hypothetical protein
MSMAQLRRSAVRLAVLQVGFAVLALLAGFGVAVASAPGGNEPAISSLPDGSLNDPPHPYEGDLRALLLGPREGGIHLDRGQGGDDYTMSLQQAASVYGDPGVAYLSGLGYRQGASWAWAEPGRSMLILLYEFGSAADAYRWTSDSIASQIVAEATTDQGEVPTIVGARYFVQTTPKDPAWTVLVYLSRNDIGALIGVRGTGRPDPQTAIQLAERQYSLLP